MPLGTAEEAARAYLLTIPAIANAVADTHGARIWPIVAPTGARRPYVTYFRVDEAGIDTQEGRADLAPIRLQFDCWADTFLSARALGKNIARAADGFAGDFDGVSIDGATSRGTRDIPEEMRQGADRPQFHAATEWDVWAKEP